MASEAFCALVTQWARLQSPDLAECVVIDVSPSGLDYVGDTESGFGAHFDVMLRLKNAPRSWLTVEGTDMESLWRHVTE